MIWYDMIWYDMIWYDMIWYDIYKLKDVSLMYEGVSIERVEQFKYLGVSFDPQLSWNEHVNDLSSIFLNVLGLFIERNTIFHCKLIIMLAQTWIFLHFDYTAVLFGPILACITVMSSKFCQIDLLAFYFWLITELQWTKCWSRLS